MSRLIVWDASAGPWLAPALRIGTALRRDASAAFPVRSWPEVSEVVRVGASLEGLGRLQAGEAFRGLDRVEFWGHGSPGAVWCGGVPLDARGASRLLAGCRNALGAEGLWWWRSCSTFRGRAGREFALACREASGLRVAGFSDVIWAWQSSLRVVPGPEWPDVEPARWSRPWSPRAVFCLSSGPPGL